MRKLFSFRWVDLLLLWLLLLASYGGDQGKAAAENADTMARRYAAADLVCKAHAVSDVIDEDMTVPGEGVYVLFAVDYVYKGRAPAEISVFIPAAPFIGRPKIYLHPDAGPVVLFLYAASENSYLLVDPHESFDEGILRVGEKPIERPIASDGSPKDSLEWLWLEIAAGARSNAWGREGQQNCLGHLTRFPGKTSEATAILLEFAQSEDNKLKLTALSILIWRQDVGAVAEAVRLVEESDLGDVEKQGLGMALEGVQSAACIEPVLRGLKSENVHLRRGASYALRSIESDLAVPGLMSALDDADHDVVLNALHGLWNLEHEDKDYVFSGHDHAPGYDLLKSRGKAVYRQNWQDWWEQHGKRKYGHLDLKE